MTMKFIDIQKLMMEDLSPNKIWFTSDIHFFHTKINCAVFGYFGVI